MKNILLITLIAILAATSIFFWQRSRDLSRRLDLIQQRAEKILQEMERQKAARQAEEAARIAREAMEKAARRAVERQAVPRIAIVLDDWGYNTKNLKTAKNGSVTITMSNKRPKGTPKANWLPAPKGEFNVMLRAYGPEGDVASGDYTPPPVKRR